MKKLMFFVFITFFLYSCAQTAKTTEISDFYNLYLKYVSLLNNKEYIEAIGFLSIRNVSDLKENANPDEFATYFPVVSSVNKIIIKEINSFEEADGGKGCLTVNGYDSSKEPTSINFEYLNESGLWKLDYIQVMYHDSVKQFPIKATCPIRF